MKRNRCFRAACQLILVLVLLTGHQQISLGQKNKKPKETIRPEKNPSLAVDEEGQFISESQTSEKIEHESRFIKAMKYFMIKDYGTALRHFVECEGKNPNNPALKYQIALTYTRLNDLDKALPYARAAVSADRSNPHYFVLLAEIFKGKNQFDNAINVYNDLIKNTSDNEDYFYELAAAYLQIGRYKDAINAYDRLEEKYGINEAVVRQKQRIYLNISDLEGALREGQKLMEHFRDTPDFATAQLQMLMANYKTERAEKVAKFIEENFPEDGPSKLVLADFYRQKGDQKSYQKMMLEAFRNSEIDLEHKLKMLIGLLQYPQEGSAEERQKDFGYELAQIVADVHPEADQANSIFADFLISRREYRKARDYYMKAIRINGDNYKLWQQIIALDWELAEWDSVIYHSEMAMEMFPNQAMLYLYHGSGHYVQKNYADAQASLEQGRMLADDPGVINQLNTQLGDIYYNLKKYDKSDAAYEAVLRTDAENMHVLNNYSYYLSMRGEKLDMALKMSQKLIEMEPDNPTYLDTHGWVLYVMKKYKDARYYIEKAAMLSPESAVIVEHLGDVLYKLGEKNKALEKWKKAKTLGEDHSPELDEKIATGKLPD